MQVKPIEIILTLKDSSQSTYTTIDTSHLLDRRLFIELFATLSRKLMTNLETSLNHEHDLDSALHILELILSSKSLKDGAICITADSIIGDKKYFSLFASPIATFLHVNIFLITVEF